MENKLKIMVSRKPPDPNGLVAYKSTRINGWLFRKLFGNPADVTVIVPGKNAAAIEIVNVDSAPDGNIACGQ